MSWYSTGTVSVVNGSPVVTGTGTSWLLNAYAGNAIRIGGNWKDLQILTVDSDTQITLNAPYPDATSSGLPYEIVPIRGPEVELFRRLNELLAKLEVNEAVLTDGLIQAVNIAELKSLAKANLVNGTRRWLLGYWEPGDCEAAAMEWDATSTLPELSGWIVASNEGGNGRWIRKVHPHYNLDPVTFGAYRYSRELPLASISSPVFSSAAIQSAALLGSAWGKKVPIPGGMFLLNDHDGDGVCVNITNSIVLQGQGSTASLLVPWSSVSDSTDIIRLRPENASLSWFKPRIEGLGFLETSNGQRYGRDAIRVDTTLVAKDINGLVIDDIDAGTSRAATPGYAFRHVNDASLNVNGGLFCSTIRHSLLRGGTYWGKSGDSNSIESSQFSGPNTNYIDLVYTVVTGGANNFCFIGRNNGTCAKGFALIDSGGGTIIEHVNVEQLEAGMTDPLIWFRGNNQRLFGGYIGTIQLGGRHPDSLKLIEIDKADAIVVGLGNRILAGYANTKLVRLTANARNCLVYPIAVSPGSGFSDRVIDEGEGTAGTIRTLPLLNGFTALGSDTPRFTRNGNQIFFFGRVTNGAAGAVFELPVGYGVTTQRMQGLGWNGSAWVTVVIEVVGRVGSLVVGTFGASTFTILNGMSVWKDGSLEATP